jgi:hypothetical protein
MSSESNNRWTRKALEESDRERRFVQEAAKAGFSEQQAMFMSRFADMKAFEKRQDFADIFTRPID